MRPTTGLPSSSDQRKMGQFLQSQASPHKCISNPPARTHPRQVLLAVQLLGVAAWPHRPLGPALTAAHGSAAPPGAAAHAQMGAQKGKQSLACDFAKSCSLQRMRAEVT